MAKRFRCWKWNFCQDRYHEPGEETQGMQQHHNIKQVEKKHMSHEPRPLMSSMVQKAETYIVARLNAPSN